MFALGVGLTMAGPNTVAGKTGITRRDMFAIVPKQTLEASAAVMSARRRGSRILVAFGFGQKTMNQIRLLGSNLLDLG